MTEFEAVNEIIEEEQDEDGLSDTRDIAKVFPQVFGKRQSGETFVRKSPYHKGKKMGGVIPSFEFQDERKSQYREHEIGGHDARFAVRLQDNSEIVFGKMMSDWLLTNSLIANMWRCGWIVVVR